MRTLRLALCAAALCAVVGWAGQSARAAFTYAVSPATTSMDFGVGSNLTLTAFNSGISSPTLSGAQIINLAQITQTSTAAPGATDTANLPFSLDVAITNQNGGGTDTVTVSGTINVLRSDAQGAISSLALASILPATLTLGLYEYSLSSPSYAAPTIGAGSPGNGALSLVITETVIPEPASLSVLAVGGAALLARRRRR